MNIAGFRQRGWRRTRFIHASQGSKVWGRSMMGGYSTGLMGLWLGFEAQAESDEGGEHQLPGLLSVGGLHHQRVVPGPDVRDAVGDERPDQVAIHQC